MTKLVDLGIATALLVTAAGHGYLYVHGYQHIPLVAPGFLVLASVCAALALLIALGGPWWLRAAAFAVSLGAVVAFVLSRTVGLMGFVEHGWQPAPHAVLSLLAEVFAAVLCGWSLRPALRVGA
jgi:glucan phosphoethanolaminetransferase (alkaline phosphatase superfamily)